MVDSTACGGLPLQIGIERGVDAQAFAVEVALAQLLHQLIVHQVDEVGRLAGVHALLGQMQRLGLGGSACSLVMAPVSTIESSTRLRRSMVRSAWRKGLK